MGSRSATSAPARSIFSSGGSLASRTSAAPRSVARSTPWSILSEVIGARTTSASVTPTWRMLSSAAASPGEGLRHDRPPHGGLREEGESQHAAAEERAPGCGAGARGAGDAVGGERGDGQDGDGRRRAEGRKGPAGDEEQ